MRSVIFAIAFLCLIQFSYARWVEKSTTVFMATKPQTVSFAFDLDQIPVPGSNYYAELQLVFAEMFDEFSLEFEGSYTGPFVAKEKGTTYTVVLSNMDGGAFNGWAYGAIQCGSVRVSLTSTSKLASAKLRLNLISTSAPQCQVPHKPNHHGSFTDHPTNRISIVGILLVSFASLFCLCCTISCVRRCAARRCSRKFKPVEEAYPAEAIAAETQTGDFVDTAQQQYVFPYPVMAVPINGEQQYVQLMPVMYGQQQQQ